MNHPEGMVQFADFRCRVHTHTHQEMFGPWGYGGYLLKQLSYKGLGPGMRIIDHRLAGWLSPHFQIVQNLLKH